jgi:hypothetical protein
MNTKPKIVFSDFDGTLTVNGMLTAQFFELLELLKKEEIPLVIVSGRSLSWGHFFLTHFPLEVVVMEGGGVMVHKNGHRLDEECLVSASDLDELQRVEMVLRKEIPGCPLSNDTFGRLTDRALELKDFPADQPDLQKRVLQIFEREKIHYSASNVHINFWKGDISKAQGIKQCLKKFFPAIKPDEVVFFGDAPNDQSVFKEFPWTVGVSNIEHSLSMIEHRPAIILKGKENQAIHGVLNYLRYQETFS